MSKTRCSRKAIAGLSTVVGVAMLAATFGSAASTAGASPSVQGVTKTTITIGTSQPSTGTAAVGGQGFDTGLQKAVKQINKEGGIDGRKIVLDETDNEFTVPQTEANFRQLIESDKVYAIVAPAETAGIPAAWPLVKSSGIPVFGPYEPTDPNLPSVFELVATQEPQAEVETKYLSGKGLKKIAFIGINNANGTENLDGMKIEAKKLHDDIVYSAEVPSGTDVSSEVLAAKSAGAQAILLGTDPITADLVLKAVAAINWHPTIIANTSAAGAGGATTVGPVGSAANGFIGALTEALTTSSEPGVKEWKNQGPEAAGASFDLNAYATALVFFHILKQMGSNLSWSHFDATAQKLKNYSTGGVFAPLTFGKLPGGHSGANFVALAQYNSTTATWTQITNFIKP
jgi:branched-chain amino acid transport system substrate-binding protein